MTISINKKYNDAKEASIDIAYYHMTQVLFDLLQSSLRQHTATVPKEHESELATHFQTTDGADVW